MEIPPVCPVAEGTKNGGDEVKTQNHIEEPQMIMGVAPKGGENVLPQPLPGKAAAGQHIACHSVDPAPEQKTDQDPQAVVKKQFGQRKGPLCIQHKHSRQHDKDRHTPAYQPIVKIESSPGGGACGYRSHLAARQMKKDDRQGGKGPQQIRIGQPPVDFLRHKATPFVTYHPKSTEKALFGKENQYILS